MNKILLALVATAGLLYANTLEKIQETKVINIGVRNNLPPFGYQDLNGILHGFDVELAQKIGKSIVGEDGKVILVSLNDSSERINVLTSNRVDLVVANFANTPQRAEMVDFSTPYMSSYLSILTRVSDEISSVEYFDNNKTLLYIEGSIGDDYKDLGNIRANWKKCKDKAECYGKLLNKEGDGFIYTNILIADLAVNNKKLEFGVPFVDNRAWHNCVGVSKGNDALREAVNKEIGTLVKNGFFTEQYEKYLEPFYQDTIHKNHILLEDVYNFISPK